MTEIVRGLRAAALFLLASNSAISVSAQAPDLQDTANDAQATVRERNVRVSDARTQNGLATFEKIKALAGEWEAPLDDGGKMINIFTPFAMGQKSLLRNGRTGNILLPRFSTWRVHS
jgi:hypothetical protein